MNKIIIIFLNKKSLAIILIYISITMVFADELTVNQSLMYIWGHNDSANKFKHKEFPIAKLNPEIKEHCRMIISDSNSGTYSSKQIGNAIVALGFVGDQNDLIFIDEYFKNKFIESIMIKDDDNEDETYKKDANGNVENDFFKFIYIFSCYGNMLGSMLERKIPGAKATIQIYCEQQTYIDMHSNWKKSRDYLHLRMPWMWQAMVEVIRGINIYATNPPIPKSVYKSKWQQSNYSLISPRNLKIIKRLQGKSQYKEAMKIELTKEEFASKFKMRSEWSDPMGIVKMCVNMKKLKEARKGIRR